MDKEIVNRSEHMKEYIDKLAAKLGLPPDKVAGAMRDMRKERMERMIKEKIQEAVEKGIITQAEADPILEWLKNRPEGVQKLAEKMFGYMGGMRGKWM